MIIGNIPEFRNSLLLLEEILDYLNTEVIFDYLLANMFFWVREKWELEIRNNPEFGQGAYASSVLCQSKRKGEVSEAIHSRSASNRIMLTSVQLEVQIHSYHKTKQKIAKQTIDHLKKNTENHIVFPHVKMILGFWLLLLVKLCGGKLLLYGSCSASAEWCLPSSALKLVLSSQNSATYKNISLCSELSIWLLETDSETHCWHIYQEH